MHKHNITRTLAADVAVAPAAAGTTAVNGNVIDCNGFESVAFVVQFGAITAGAVTAVKVQQGDAADGSDMADVPGATVDVLEASSNKGVFSAEVHRPRKRYLRVVVARATQNSVVAGGFALLGRAGAQPPAVRPNMQNATPPVVVSP